MEPSHWCKASTLCFLSHHHFHHHRRHHHHHCPFIFFRHHHHLVIYPHHQHHLNCRCHTSAVFTPLPPQNSEPFAAVPLRNQLNLDLQEAEPSRFKDTSGYESRMLQDQEYKVSVEEAEEEEGEPIFVLTDEWREFFAASEAKRKLEKKQTKKK